MPKKRLNITLDHETAERARRYTQRHNTSISRLVGEFLSRLPDSQEKSSALTPAVRRLLGIAEGGPAFVAAHTLPTVYYIVAQSRDRWC
jgi:hypothetical protein